MQEIKSKIARVIADKRSIEHLTRKELSETLGISQSTLYRFESETANPRWRLFKKVVTGLGLRLVVK